MYTLEIAEEPIDSCNLQFMCKERFTEHDEFAIIEGIKEMLYRHDCTWTGRPYTLHVILTK